jgi:endoglucanase
MDLKKAIGACIGVAGCIGGALYGTGYLDLGLSNKPGSQGNSPTGSPSVAPSLQELFPTTSPSTSYPTSSKDWTPMPTTETSLKPTLGTIESESPTQASTSSLCSGVFKKHYLRGKGVESVVSCIENTGTNYFDITPGYFSEGAGCVDENGSKTCKATLGPNEAQAFEIPIGGEADIQENACSNSVEGSCDGYLGHFGIRLKVLGDGTVTATSEGVSGGYLSIKSVGGSNTDYGVAFIAGSSPTLEPVSGPPSKHPTSAPSRPTNYPSSVMPSVSLAPTTEGSNPSNYGGYLKGFNAAGAEFDSGFMLPSFDSIMYFVNKGANAIRLPFSMKNLLEGSTYGALDFSKGNAKAYKELVEQCTKEKVTIVIDMHDYMRYQNQIIGVDGPSTEQYAEAWKSIAQEFKDNEYVIFDLMNEPNSMQTEQILKNYNAAIEQIRNVGAKQLILLEGNQWTCMAAWGGNNYSRNNPYGTSPTYYGTANSELFTPENILDPVGNYAINVHEYFSEENGCGSEGECIDPSKLNYAEMMPDFVNWLKETGQKAFLTEMSGISSTNCLADIDQFLSDIESNFNQANGFVGWFGWAGGDAWPQDYVFYLGPDANGDDKPQMTEGFMPHMVAPSYVS